MNEFWDRLGISASLFCILHCLLTPIAIIFMPFLGEIMSHALFHVIMVLIVVPVAVWALWNGFKIHHNPLVLWLGSAGIIFIILAITIGQKTFAWEVALMTCAGLLLASAHWFNLKVCRRKH